MRHSGKNSGKNTGKPGRGGGSARGRSPGKGPGRGRSSGGRDENHRDTARAETRAAPGGKPGRNKSAHKGASQKQKGPAQKWPASTRARAEDAPNKHERKHERRPSSRAAATTQSSPPSSGRGPRANLFGLHAVRAAWLNPARSIHALYLTPENEDAFATWPQPRVARPMPVIADRATLERMLGRDSVHQGFAASAAPLAECFVQDIIAIGAGKDKSIIVMLDQVTDPHNVGAVLRSASAFGADGVVMQRRHAPELEGVLCKTASGAVEHLPVAYETNLSRALEELKDSGYTVIGLDEHADKTFSSIAIPQKAVLVLGNEGEGMRRLIREHCDVLVTLPTQKPINSLNVSNAAAVALYALAQK